MGSTIKSHNLSIVALRILPGGKDYIQKCLKENVFYYLNTNYEISIDGESIKPRTGFIDSIDDNFFDLYDGVSSPNINISAIVGKNGDGKSSLIEVMIRLINNFACAKGLNLNDHLIYVDGVYGELHYRLDGKFFRIKITEGRKNKPYVLVHNYKWDETGCTYKICRNQLTDSEIQRTSFYTLVSNYSHFSYNTEEFIEENLPDAVGGHWLDKVFHKNDAYQTPINLHPYRHKGNIDINRERLLSTQRLLVSIASSIKKDEKEGIESTIDINGKVPYELRLKDIGYSKLQNYTIKKYLEDNRDSNIIEHHIDSIMESTMKIEDRINGDRLIRDIAEPSFSLLRKHYFDKSKIRYFKVAISWFKNQGLLRENSDLSKLIGILVKYSSESYVYIPTRHLSIWKELSCLSGTQFLRLALVYDICKMWNTVGLGVRKTIRLSFDPTAIFKPYWSLSNAEKCCHYIIYKTIEIFNTYVSYGDPIKGYSSAEVFFSYRNSISANSTLFNLEEAFERLSVDWHKKSHITLKLRQAYNLLRNLNSSKKLYASVSRYKGKYIVFERLSEKYTGTLSNIESLPPPIFKWDIIYRRKDQANPIPFSTFSSGEKQKLLFQSAIIYHLRNINSIGEEKIHYHSVNLVFEEIELYFHPEWQRTLIFDLMQSIRRANIPNISSINLIFVTHSPYILSDIPKSNVLFLKDGMPVYEMQENTFGANINSLLKNGFFLPSLPMGEFAYRKINILFAKLHSGQFNPNTLNQLYAQIMTVGEPAIRAQLMSLLAPYRKLFLS